jgi:L-ascorbate metabolism protein UlaG (beta-lactamase superfamily)
MNPIDVAVLPIGDNFTMGIDDAVKATELLAPAMTIPMHYDTFDLIKADPQEFVGKVEARGGRARVVKPGERYELS